MKNNTRKAHQRNKPEKQNNTEQEIRKTYTNSTKLKSWTPLPTRTSVASFPVWRI